MITQRFTLAALMTAYCIGTLLSSSALARSGGSLNAVDQTKHVAEAQVKNLLEPLLDKYCRDECKLMGVTATVDLATPDEIAPGFDEIDPKGAMDLAPSSAQVKLLIDEKVGPVSRGKLMELIQQYLDTLDFPVKIVTQTTRFPQPQGSAGRVAELREKVTKQFRSTLDDLFHQFCPDHCLLADYELKTDLVNAEEAQYGASGEYVEDNGIAIRIRDIAATILVDDTLPADERANLVEMAKLKTNFLKNVTLTAKAMKFPHPMYDANGTPLYDRASRGLAGSKDAKDSKESRELKSQATTDSKNSTDSKSSTDSKLNENNSSTTNNHENTARQERFEHYEKIERVENGDAVQAELQKFKVYGIVFGCSVLTMLLFLILSAHGGRIGNSIPMVQRVFQNMASDPITASAPQREGSSDRGGDTDRSATVVKRYEIERLIEELMSVFAQSPRVAKQVFSRILTEEGIEITAHYIQIFGESVVIDMLRDPSLQSDLNELMEFYAKNPMDIGDDDKLDLLKRLHNRTVAGKLVVLGNRSSNLFDFLTDMDGIQIMELVRNESLTVKSIVMTQCDPQKRTAIYTQLDEDTRMKLLTELSRIDYLPRDYIFNVANALKRKRRENPKLNTESMPGSDVLVNLLERTGSDVQRSVVKNLELTNPDSARTVKAKLVSVDTLKFLRDGQLLEVVLSLRHDELLQFLKGTSAEIRGAIFAKSPKDLVVELEEELEQVQPLSRETYQGVERKVVNRMKIMAGEGLINLIETNDRMLAVNAAPPLMEAGPAEHIKKAAGW
jgi:flagellar motor switch protein FliG